MSAQSVIQRFGGIKPMHRKTGIPASTIQYWHQENRIPEKRRIEVIKKAKAHGLKIDHLDFLPDEFLNAS